MGEENIIKDKTETKGMSNQKKILSLQGLRAVMFFLIFFFHSDLYLDRYFVFNRFFIGGGGAWQYLYSLSFRGLLQV